MTRISARKRQVTSPLCDGLQDRQTPWGLFITCPPLPFQLLAVPARQVRTRFIRALAEIEDRLCRRRGGARVVILEDELAQLLIPIGRAGKHGLALDSGGRRLAVRIERGVRKPAVAGPETATDHFMRISLPGERIGVRWQGGAPAGEARHRQVERAPEEMDRARLADKAAPELLED